MSQAGLAKMMNDIKWLEVSVEVDHETAEAVAELLSRHADHGVVIEGGPQGWDEEPVMVRGYLPAGDDLWRRKKKVEEGLWHLGQIRPISEPSFRTVTEEDWAEAWRERLEVLHIGDRLVIRPSWLDYEPQRDDVVIALDPGMAFGTGLHPTTQLCLTALEELVQPGMRVLDLGTGSGILAVAAAKLGAEGVLALDTDAQAVGVARRNVAGNGVSDLVEVRPGSLSEVSETYDLVMVNIVSRVIVEMVESGLSQRLRPDGAVIAAGITADQVSDVVESFEQDDLELVGQMQRGDWVNLRARRI